MSAIKELAKLLKEAQEHQKSKKEEIRIVQEEVHIVQEEDTSLVSKTASYLSAPRKREPTPTITENIEAQRWNDPLRKEVGEKFVTFKEMNDHYGLFLQRIQQQMSSIGGGGEVNLRYLDDLNFSTVGTNKYLTYDQATKKFKFDVINNGVGLYLNANNEVTLSVASTSDLGGIKVGTAFEIDGSDRLQLKVATNTDLGGVKLGPGVTVNNQNQIIIDSSGLDFNFGDFIATVPPNGAATLSSANLGQDIDIVSSANGVINVVGNFHVHTTDNYDPNVSEADGAIFRVDAEGKVRMLVPAADSNEGAINIIGGLDGIFQAPVNTGVMLHVTGIAGTPGVPSRIYNDAQNSFAAFVARRYNNTAASPSAVLANEEIMRISGTAHNGTIIPGTGNQRIVYRALGNQTLTNQGGAIELWTTPLNSSTIAKVATIDNADGITATKFTGQLIREYRDVGVIADGGTVTIDFSTDAIVHVSWDNGFTLAYQNYTAGSVVKFLATKRAGTGTDSFSLDGITASQVSSGSTTVAASAGQTYFVEFICTGTDIGSIYAKL